MSLDPRTIAGESREGIVGSDRWAGLDRHNGDRAVANRPFLERLRAGGTSGNERLTTATGILLLLLLTVIGVTLLRLRSLLWVHLFVGMLLIGPIALKLASTGYRFVRYYTADPRYRRKGPPLLGLRMIAPIVVLTTVIVLASGVLLLLIGPSSRSALLPLHKISFIVWAAFTSLHVLGHLPEVAAAVGLGGETASKVDVLAAVGASEGADLSAWQAPDAAAAVRAGRGGRGLSLAGALAGGTVLAVATIPQFGPWLHASTLFHHH
jgi:hypothetical protein